ncbi:hypothetical protein BU23DRAFT_567238 [Bimuria novae-zelandiae CBS 107.79]|uniref:Uncharacterized protein n=1 Tax=Bimuria novae-zelandiae CBS 107.79 TaxID=1447943 RepID=A0A6A5VCJ6_9PLEO|nr:hypothetical protein BU23DRAFT_567238 [Bimuria novae-zelandiae CBS 107.79]
MGFVAQPGLEFTLLVLKTQGNLAEWHPPPIETSVKGRAHKLCRMKVGSWDGRSRGRRKARLVTVSGLRPVVWNVHERAGFRCYSTRSRATQRSAKTLFERRHLMQFFEKNSEVSHPMVCDSSQQTRMPSSYSLGHNKTGDVILQAYRIGLEIGSRARRIMVAQHVVSPLSESLVACEAWTSSMRMSGMGTILFLAPSVASGNVLPREGLGQIKPLMRPKPSGPLSAGDQDSPVLSSTITPKMARSGSFLDKPVTQLARLETGAALGVKFGFRSPGQEVHSTQVGIGARNHPEFELLRLSKPGSGTRSFVPQVDIFACRLVAGAA